MSMSGFHRAFVALLKQSGLPVYLAGQLPGNAPFPYITFTMGCAGFCGAAPITLTAWFLGRSGTPQRAELCDRMQALFPEGGIKLTFEGGVATIHRASDFISLITDATEPRSLGARIRLSVKLYDP